MPLKLSKIWWFYPLSMILPLFFLNFCVSFLCSFVTCIHHPPPKFPKFDIRVLCCQIQSIIFSFSDKKIQNFETKFAKPRNKIQNFAKPWQELKTMEQRVALLNITNQLNKITMETSIWNDYIEIELNWINWNWTRTLGWMVLKPSE